MSFEIPALKYRLIFGLVFFLIMGIRDYLKNPQDPKRAKEYLFITLTTILAICFAILHDFITFNISKEYFSIAKELGDTVKFYPDILVLAITASYWVGIIIGVVFVVSNNPSKTLPQISYGNLAKVSFIPFTTAILTACLAFALSKIIAPIFSKNGIHIIYDPAAFESVAFIHWGTYIGALLGLIVSVFIIRKKRKMNFKG